MSVSGLMDRLTRLFTSMATCSRSLRSCCLKVMPLPQAQGPVSQNPTNPFGGSAGPYVSRCGGNTSADAKLTQATHAAMMAAASKTRRTAIPSPLVLSLSERSPSRRHVRTVSVKHRNNTTTPQFQGISLHQYAGHAFDRDQGEPSFMTDVLRENEDDDLKCNNGSRQSRPLTC